MKKNCVCVFQFLCRNLKIKRTELNTKRKQKDQK